jgi:hypothetical protein
VVFVLYILGILIAAAIFISVRRFWCWYFKIDQRLEKYDEIISLLRDIKQRNGGNSGEALKG